MDTCISPMIMVVDGWMDGWMDPWGVNGLGRGLVVE